MAQPRNEPTTLLGEAIRKRIQQLGISRRELAKRSGISKQTIHELEHAKDKGFNPRTFEQLDDALKWKPGTSLAYHLGDDEAGNGEPIDERVSRYFDAIVRHLATMNVEDLEREVLMLDEESFGRTIQSIEERTDAYEASLGELAKRLAETWESLNGNV